MIIAIDESGSFGAGLRDRSFFIAVHIRQRKTLYKLKRQQFVEWEGSLPKALKNPKGEIKSSALSDDQLTDFARRVICAHYSVGITPFTVRPSDNSESVIEKHRQVALIGICESAKEYARLEKPRLAQLYNEFGHWLKKLSYPQYLKIFVLGECLATAMVNTVGHAISGGYDTELPRMQFLIDRDFIKEPRPNVFWRQLLRHQLYYASKENPLPILKRWITKGHPFLEKYTRNGELNFNEIFSKYCTFVPSHEHFEVRIADAVNTIVSRYFNKRQCRNAYELVQQCFLQNRKIIQVVHNDFDLEAWHYDPNDNPWKTLPFQELLATGSEPSHGSQAEHND
jgi:hypothetical protein